MAVKGPMIDSALPADAGRRTCIHGGDESSDTTATAFVPLARVTWGVGKGGRGGGSAAFRLAIENRAALKATGLDLESKGHAKFSRMNELLDEARLE